MKLVKEKDLDPRESLQKYQNADDELWTSVYKGNENTEFDNSREQDRPEIKYLNNLPAQKCPKCGHTF
jgi:hypothetical protein